MGRLLPYAFFSPVLFLSKCALLGRFGSWGLGYCGPMLRPPPRIASSALINTSAATDILGLAPSHHPIWLIRPVVSLPRGPAVSITRHMQRLLNSERPRLRPQLPHHPHLCCNSRPLIQASGCDLPETLIGRRSPTITKLTPDLTFFPSLLRHTLLRI